MSRPTRRFLALSLLTLAALALPSHAHADVSGTPPDVVITSPTDGALVESPVDVVLSVEGDFITHISLYVDGEPAGAILYGAPWTFPAVPLDEGMHSLVAIAHAVSPFAGDYPSEVVNVAVLGSAGTESGSNDEATSESGGDSGEESGTKKSKGCSVTPAGGLGGLALAGLALFGLIGMRRRS